MAGQETTIELRIDSDTGIKLLEQVGGGQNHSTKMNEWQLNLDGGPWLRFLSFGCCIDGLTADALRTIAQIIDKL